MKYVCVCACVVLFLRNKRGDFSSKFDGLALVLLSGAVGSGKRGWLRVGCMIEKKTHHDNAAPIDDIGMLFPSVTFLFIVGRWCPTQLSFTLQPNKQLGIWHPGILSAAAIILVAVGCIACCTMHFMTVL